ncbi:MAG: MATE family efflux transporter [Planctomycetes bacterium]|nr:MATE family efflux transporter [Planctomycetota bacterium]
MASAWWRRFHARHLAGEGGVLELLPIAVPMFLSSVFDMLQMMIDRVFLAHVGKVQQAAAMSGGVTSWMCLCLFAGMIGYSSALVAQYCGAGARDDAARVFWQAIRLSFLCYPLVLLVDFLVANCTPVFSGHSPLEQALETRYFWYMAFGSILALVRFALGSFFAGIGRTGIVMAANAVAMVVNVVANWALIFGHCGFPALGLDGAAIGTLVSGALMCAMLAAAFLKVAGSPEYRGSGAAARRRDAGLLAKLVRYGLPQGVENLLGCMSFVVLVTSFHRYGEDMAAATTIAFNWDGMSFHPLLGIQVGVTTLVGRAMGRERPDVAARVGHSGFKVGLAYAFFMVAVFSAVPQLLVGIFTPDGEDLDYAKVREYAVPMLRLVGLYLVTDAVQLMSAGVLRGAGDTFWSMVITMCRDWTVAASVLVCVHLLGLGPMQTWTAFVGTVVVCSVPLFLRYRSGKWKTLRIIKD